MVYRFDYLCPEMYPPMGKDERNTAVVAVPMVGQGVKVVSVIPLPWERWGGSWDKKTQPCGLCLLFLGLVRPVAELA